jgi:hypothetical protein
VRGIKESTGDSRRISRSGGSPESVICGAPHRRPRVSPWVPLDHRVLNVVPRAGAEREGGRKSRPRACAGIYFDRILRWSSSSNLESTGTIKAGCGSGIDVGVPASRQGLLRARGAPAFLVTP